MRTKPKSFTDPKRSTPIGMVRYSIEFYAAAIATDRAIGGMDGYELHAPIPVNYLIGHAIELALKAYLLQNGVDLAGIRRIGHQLCVAYDEARKLGLDDHFKPENGDVSPLQVLDALYSDKQFEYIETGFKTFPVFGPLQLFARGLLLGVTRSLPDGESDTRRERFCNARPAYAQSELIPRWYLKKRRGGEDPVAPDLLSRWSRAESAPLPGFTSSLAGDPSEVTALEIRHWITSFRWFRDTQYRSRSRGS
ncbi:hypothetical protein Q2941_27420 [Bradyrhizobium sp. UFLA05-153]